MSLPVNIDEYSKLIVQNDAQLIEQHIHPATLERVHRVRGLYAHWLQFPEKFDKEIVEFCIQTFGVSRAQAYDDLHLTQLILGNLQAASKEFMRWKINKDLEQDLMQARKAEDWKSVASIEKNRIKNNRTDKEDEVELEFDKIIPQTFEPTSDPSVVGITSWKGKTKLLRERTKMLIAKYSKNMINMEDAEYEEVEEVDDDE